MAPNRKRLAPSWLPRTKPLVPPIHHSVTYFLDDVAYADIQERGGFREIWYGRFANPTAQAAAAEIAELEGAERGLMTSSGMAAIATTLLTLCSSGDCVVASKQLYGDTHDLLVRDLPGLGIEVIQVDVDDDEAWRKAATQARPKVLYTETLSNPTLRLADLRELAYLAREVEAHLVVDNTFATPYAIKPISLGADVVVHSATKFLNGHSDAIAGVVLSNERLCDEIARRIVTLGTSLDPHAAYQVWRGLQTFGLRMERQTSNAAVLAEWLAEHPRVNGVVHPSRRDYPRNDLAILMLGVDTPCALVAFAVEGGDPEALRVMRSAEIASEATSLGGVETLISAPFNSSHFMLTPEQRSAAGIGPGMLRVSVGVEPVEDLIADFDRALALAQTRDTAIH
jgi:cystathionine beta-lyase/cystathionine gamma-synthase